MKQRGFTIVELVIVITIMGILLVMAVVNLSGSQINARDAERKADIETIASLLETYYKSGSDQNSLTGVYPSTADMTGITAQQDTLPDINVKSLVAPGAPDSAITSLIPASNDSETTAGVQPVLSSSKAQNQYIYQPLYLNDSGQWKLCVDSNTQECRRFNLFYKSESLNAVQPPITSKNQ